MEASHKKDILQWTTIDHGNYCVQTNGGEVLDGVKAFEIGNYNALLKGCPAYEKYELDDDFEKSHDLFRDALVDGFPWEVLKVLSGPPIVVFTWRHWGKFTGKFRGRQGNGELVELYGILRVTVNNDLKIQKIEAYFDPESFLKVMEGELHENELCNGRALLGDTSAPAIEKN